jgi:hypothetical protein
LEGGLDEWTHQGVESRLINGNRSRDKVAITGEQNDTHR